MGQPTEKPVIVEALDFTFRTIEERIKRYRNLVISVVMLTAVSLILAIFFHRWLFVTGLILLVPLVGRFSIADSRSVRRWRAQILGMSRARNLDLEFYVKTASDLQKAAPKMLHDMLATIPVRRSLNNDQDLSIDPFEAAQEKLEKKTIIGLILLTAVIFSGAAAVVFYSGGLLLLTVGLFLLLTLLRR